jgi:drug/metabolite transporter (DMT)-like permease
MSERQKAVLAMVVVLAAWALSSLFMKYLILNGYDPHTQNFYRYAVGTLCVLPFLVRRLRQRGARLAGRTWLRLLVPVAPNVAHQVAWVVALLWVYPALSSFLNKSSVLFAALLAFALFPEERWLLRSGRFMAGLGLCVVGTVGLALWRADLERLEINVAVALVLFAALSWAVYSVSVKRLTEQIGSTVSFGIVGVYTTAVLLWPALAWGNLGHWRDAPWQVNAVLIGSGALCIGLAHTLYYYTIRVLGVSVCATLLLTTPLATLAMSRWWFGEELTGGQLVSGILLIAGGAMTLLAREKPAPLPLVKAAETAGT